MSNEEESAPSAPGSEIGNDNTASNAEQASLAHKRGKTVLTKCNDEYTVSKQREALTAKANTGKFYWTACGDACEVKLCENSKALWQGFRAWGFVCHAAGFQCKNTCKLHSEMFLLLHIRLRIFF